MSHRISVHHHAKVLLRAKSDWANEFAGEVIKFDGMVWLITAHFEKIVSLFPKAGVEAKLPEPGRYQSCGKFEDWVFCRLNGRLNRTEEIIGNHINTLFRDLEIPASTNQVGLFKTALISILLLQ